MHNSTKIVVADTFENFAIKHEQVITYSELIEILSNVDLPEENLGLIPGQGITTNTLRDVINHNESKINLYIINQSLNLPKAGSKTSHKNLCHNIAVSIPTKISESEYILSVNFESGNEFFQDHMTGQHIQGMAVMEVMRQSFLAVSDKFFTQPDNKKRYFVIHDMNTSFSRFIFPLEATVKYSILGSEKNGDKYSSDVNVSIVQANEVCATGKIKFTAYDANFIEKREHISAKDVISTYISKIEQPQLKSA